MFGHNHRLEGSCGNIVLSFALSSILPASHPKATTLVFSPYDFLPDPGLVRGPCPKVHNELISALALDKDLYTVFFKTAPSVPVSAERPLHVMKDNQGIVVFVVMSLLTLACPRSGTHKSPCRQVWFNKSSVSLRCFSRRCLNSNSSLHTNKGMVHSITWPDLFLMYLCGTENEDATVMDVLHSIVLSYF